MAIWAHQSGPVTSCIPTSNKLRLQDRNVPVIRESLSIVKIIVKHRLQALVRLATSIQGAKGRIRAMSRQIVRLFVGYATKNQRIATKLLYCNQIIGATSRAISAIKTLRVQFLAWRWQYTYRRQLGRGNQKSATAMPLWDSLDQPCLLVIGIFYWYRMELSCYQWQTRFSGNATARWF